MRTNIQAALTKARETYDYYFPSQPTLDADSLKREKSTRK